ncbi:beta-caryophyllene synthase [Tanacetum coccineum]
MTGNVGQCSPTAPLNVGNVSINTNDPNNSSLSLLGPTFYAKLVSGEPSRNVSPTTRKSVYFRTLIRSAGNGADVGVPLESIRAISEWFENTAYGFFLGKRVAYPVIVKYFRNSWSKCGLVKSMLSSSNGLFLFQINSKDDLDSTLENGPWFIRNNPLILKKWNPDVNLLKEDVVNVPLDSYTSNMCMQSLDRSSYARAMIEIQAGVELKYTIVVAMLKLVGEGYYSANTGGKKKQAKLSSQKVSNSNTFDALNSVEDDDDLGTNGGNSKSPGKGSLNVAHGSSSNTPIIEKIDKLEHQIFDGKLMFVDDNGKPLYKVVIKGNENSASEVEVVFDETGKFNGFNE